MEGDVFDGETSLDRQNGQSVPFQWQPGPQTQLGSDAAGADDESVVGQNFDVVVHMAAKACRSQWSREDMQLEGDWGDVAAPTDQDYPYGAADIDGADGLTEHDHADSVEKRHKLQPDYNEVFTVVDEYLTRATGGGGTDSGRWPNFGAYAAFYSFVTCANVDPAAAYSSNPYKVCNMFHVVYDLL